MSRSAPCLSVLILTEDSAKDAPATITALLKKMFQLIVPGCGTHRIRFEPANKQAAEAVRGSCWKSASPRDHRKLVDLRRTIATKLLEGKLEDPSDVPGFVVFHIDGDRPWSDHKTSENAERFEAFIERLDPLLREALNAKGLGHELEARRLRLRRLMPFYCIEAWLYQNLTEVRRRCAEGCGAHLAQMTAWEADRAQLDELAPPADALPCLSKQHNLALATAGFPAEAALAADASFAAAVAHLLDAHELGTALARTAA